MFYGFSKFIYNKLPYFRYYDNANNDNCGAEGRTPEEIGTCESSQSSEAGGETTHRIEITSEEVSLDGVEQIDTYSAPAPSPTSTNAPNSPRACGSSHITVTTANSTRSGQILSYNERSGECVVQDAHGNLITLNTCGNPWKNHTR